MTTRIWTQKRRDLFVITGAVFDQNNDKVPDDDNAARRAPPHNRVATGFSPPQNAVHYERMNDPICPSIKVNP